MTPPRPPTLLAILERPGDEVGVAGGLLATSAWRGAHVAFVTLLGGDEPALREPLRRAAALLGVRDHFAWHGSEVEYPPRLVRLLRALQPAILIAPRAIAPLVEEAWEQSSAQDGSMPGLRPFAAEQARLWIIEDHPTSVHGCVDISLARPLLRAARYYYVTAEGEGKTPLPKAVAEKGLLTLRRGAPLPGPTPVEDLFAGMPGTPTRPPIAYTG